MDLETQCAGCEKPANPNYYDGEWWCDDCIERIARDEEELKQAIEQGE